MTGATTRRTGSTIVANTFVICSSPDGRAGAVVLEAVVAEPPDLLVLTGAIGQYRTVVADNLKHPALAWLRSQRPSIVLPSWSMLCGTQHTADAVELLAHAVRAGEHVDVGVMDLAPGVVGTEAAVERARRNAGPGGHDHPVVGTPTGAACPSPQTLTYDNFGRQFMTSYCLRCHSETVKGATRNGAPATACVFRVS